MVKPSLGVGVIGANPAGSWGAQAHIPAIQAIPGFHLAGIATSSAASAERAAAHFGAAQGFADAHALVTDPTVDVVAICVRVPEHRRLVTMAIEAGKHVYCEWPLGRDSQEARDLYEAANASGVVHMVGLQARVAPAIRHLADLLASGRIGAPQGCMLSLAGSWPSRKPANYAYLDDVASGGHFLSIPAGHAIDAFLHVLGEFASFSAVAATLNPITELLDTGERIARSSIDQLGMAGKLRGGAVATIRAGGGDALGSGIRIEINGEKGSLMLDAPGASHLQFAKPTLKEIDASGSIRQLEIPIDAKHASLPAGPAFNVALMYQQLERAIRKGDAASPDFGDALARHLMLEAVMSAARSGERATVSD